MVGDEEGRIIDDRRMPTGEMKEWQLLQEWFDQITGITVVQLPYHEPNMQLELWPEWYGFF